MLRTGRVIQLDSLREQVEAILSSAIISGEMEPGKIFSVPTLAAQLEVSATPVREALLHLMHRGFVVPVKNKGYRVTEQGESELREIVGVRLLLEPPAMRELAGCFPAERAEEMRALALETVEAADALDLPVYLRSDVRFHVELMRLLGNEVLVDLVQDLRLRTRAVNNDAKDLDLGAAEHLQLLELVMSGRGEEAEVLMREHITKAAAISS